MVHSISNQQTSYNVNSEFNNVLKIVSNQSAIKNNIRKLPSEVLDFSTRQHSDKVYKLNTLSYNYFASRNFKDLQDNDFRDVQLRSRNEFLNKLYQTLEPLAHDANLNVDGICAVMCISKTNLFTKLKAFTGLSITHFMRKIRLNNAKILLSQTDMTISEIAYSVGFNDPKYFTRVFGEEFGKSPKEVRSQWK